MIPYFEIPTIGPLKPFGILVATGIILGSWFAQRRARQAKINLDEVRSAVAWAVVVGFIGAHLIALIYYKPLRIADEGPLVLLKIWDGISSFGGFLGALVGLFIFYGRISRPMKIQAIILALPFLAGWLTGVHALVGQIAFGLSVVAIFAYYWRPDKPWFGVAEVILQALVVGWVFGRAGCTVAFDHPGLVTDFFLGHQYGINGPYRHNLGLYEFLYTLLVLLPVMLLMYRRNPPMGLMTAVICGLYAPARFGADFLRARDMAGSDTRILGMTPAQYLAIALAIFSVWVFYRVWRGVKTDPDYPRARDLSTAMRSSLADSTVAKDTKSAPKPKTSAGKAAQRSRSNRPKRKGKQR